MIQPPQHLIDDVIRRALAEDLGDAGDITTAAIIAPGSVSRAVIAARKPGTIAGLNMAARVFDLLGGGVTATPAVTDGDSVDGGAVLMHLAGATATILSGERVALNLLGRMSGVATATARIVRAVAGTSARICCTRKTIPGLRALEKYAVRCGGGINHRFGLYDAVLIKDNHIAAAGGVAAAIKAAQAKVGHMVKIEVEVDTLDQLDAALAAGADVVLLDNMSPAQLKEAVGRAHGRAVTEASGSVTADTAPAIAAAGVDLISVGWITHSAPCLDVGLDFIA
ncbi:MAG: carboxylating nicotinate-nucleotide diphosphorylase [Rhodospirillaceae bacterium]|nr:carboxylating nicotinate-nucleotide diphosphorylase [Rhodospirillaceae bacterium]